MGVVCVGYCPQPTSKCPKHRPPSFNPQTRWLLHLVMIGPNVPEFAQWMALRKACEARRIDLGPLKPVQSRFPSSPDLPNRYPADAINEPEMQRGALSEPLSYRPSTALLPTEQIVSLMEPLKVMLEEEEEDLAPLFPEPLIRIFRQSAEKMVAIARCAMATNPAIRLVIAYGW